MKFSYKLDLIWKVYTFDFWEDFNFDFGYIWFGAYEHSSFIITYKKVKPKKEAVEQESTADKVAEDDVSDVTATVVEELEGEMEESVEVA